MAGSKSSEKIMALLGAMVVPGLAASSSPRSTFVASWLLEPLLAKEPQRMMRLEIKLTNVNKINGMLANNNTM